MIPNYAGKLDCLVPPVSCCAWLCVQIRATWKGSLKLQEALEGQREEKNPKSSNTEKCKGFWEGPEGQDCHDFATMGEPRGKPGGRLVPDGTLGLMISKWNKSYTTLLGASQMILFKATGFAWEAARKGMKTQEEMPLITSSGEQGPEVCGSTCFQLLNSSVWRHGT